MSSERTTFHGWKSLCRRNYPNCYFEGNKDICQAFVGPKGVGEWDGAKGIVYAKEESNKWELTFISMDSVPFPVFTREQLAKV